MLQRFFLFFGFVIVCSIFLHAQDLTDKQRSLAGRYAQLEQILLRLSETSANSNPRQATLLKKVLLESKDKLLVQRFETLVNALERRQFSDAVSGQSGIEQDLILLLRLLESVNRDEQREKEKEKIQEFLRDLEDILYNERALKNQTRQQETENLPMLEGNQRNIRMKTQTLRDRFAEYEGAPPQNDNITENESGESTESQDGQSQESQSQGGQQQGEQSSGGESQENRTSQEESPAQRTMQRAIERMKRAEQRLKEAEKAGSIEEQEEAIAELQRLKEELEKILRQLREEELLQTLEKLEARFKRMLQQEQTIHSQTETLINELAGESAPDQRQTKIRADRLAGEQQAVIEDSEAALLLLREDGTAQAMVELLLQARFDMTDVRSRLAQPTLDSGTLHIEEAVIDAFREMLEAVQTAMGEARERQENQQQQMPSGMGGAEEEPLIQLLAELRMIRSMQRRVNERTERYDSEIKQVLGNPDVDLDHFKRAVEELARQQNRISRILRELRMGRTQ